MKRTTILTLLFAVLTVSAVSGQSKKESFEEFRNRVKSDFNNYRNEVLSNYASFLEGVWKDYDAFRGEERETAPKPKVAPVYTPDSGETPELPAKKPEPPVTKPEPPAPVSPSVPVAKSQNGTFPFYSINIDNPSVALRPKSNLRSNQDYAAAWRVLDEDRNSSTVVRELQSTADKLGFNDFLTFDMVRHWADANYGDLQPSGRMSLVHYVMANMGYDVRLAVANGSLPLLMLSTKQQIYSRPYLMADGRKYYLFPLADNVNLDGARISTSDLKGGNNGRPLDLVLSPLNIPVKEHPFAFEYGGMAIKGVVNANLMPILYRYPQMPYGDYARSNLQPQLRKQLVDDFKRQIGNGTDRERADRLLQFTQSAFVYATDDELHGFEKPYLLEEILYYPKCDCEDRAVFYTYMLWNVLGLKCQLLNYPGHESAAVSLPDGLKGDGYQYDGKNYYISDPTYIGSRTGMSMPNFRSVKPNIDFEY